MPQDKSAGLSRGTEKLPGSAQLHAADPGSFFTEETACASGSKSVPALLLRLAHLLHQCGQLLIFSSHIAVILPFVGKHTSRTIFNPAFRITKIPAAPFSQCIKRAITKKAVKIIRVRSLMAGKKFTALMTEIGVLFSVPVWFLHKRFRPFSFLIPRA